MKWQHQQNSTHKWGFLACVWIFIFSLLFRTFFYLRKWWWWCWVQNKWRRMKIKLKGIYIIWFFFFFSQIFALYSCCIEGLSFNFLSFLFSYQSLFSLTPSVCSQKNAGVAWGKTIKFHFIDLVIFILLYCVWSYFYHLSLRFVALENEGIFRESKCKIFTFLAEN